jgi:type 1 glutamine amidotransferase
MIFRRALLTFGIGLASVLLAFASAGPRARVLIIVGPTNHPPGTHEIAASGRLLKYCTEHMAGLPGVQADVLYAWPLDEATRDGASTVILLGDTFPAMRLPGAQRNLAQLGAMMARGCGIVCVHYSTGLRADDVADDGDHPLLHWTGGYFATKCKHHQSVAKVFPAATISPAASAHPVSRGWREFTLNDEPYYNNYFGRDRNRLMPGVTALATSMLPPESPQREIVAWSIERRDGGRGFGIVMPHFYRNWKNEDLRRFILNGVAWTAKLEVPLGGVGSTLPDLATFAPGSVEPQPHPTKANSGAK